MIKPRFVLGTPSPNRDEATQLLYFGEPIEILSTDQIDEVKSVISRAEAYALAGSWVVGFVSYEAAPAFDKAFKVCSGGKLPFAWFAVFSAPLELDEVSVAPLANGSQGQSAKALSVHWQESITPLHFNQDFERIRTAIQEGDVYQVNHTLRLKSCIKEDVLDWFIQQRKAQPDSYSAYLDIGDFQIASFSPELFFQRDYQQHQGHQVSKIVTRPMKGTAPRGCDLQEDEQMMQDLHDSEKNRAENLMIVDLLRNDLSRIEGVSEVFVPDLFSVEKHPTILQMTSTVAAWASADVRLDEIFEALFPCGSVTGAPKIKAMEMISELETSPREVYCGAIGLIRPGGAACFSVAIRSVLLDVHKQEATYGVGAGITWGSDTDDEYAEVMLKARFLLRDTRDFELFETLRLESGAFVRLNTHLSRLSASAQYFAYPFDQNACCAQLQNIIEEKKLDNARVRIRLQQTGKLQIDLDSLPELPKVNCRFRLAKMPVASDNIWLYHKTTRREVYEEAWAQQIEAENESQIFDVLLWNEREELTEFTRGNLILDIDGKKLTPQRSCGLLNGCLRQELLEQGEIEEAILTLDDLARAQHIWFANSLRGQILLDFAPAEVS